MPKSEAHLDASADTLRVRLPGFTDSVGGVRFVDGEALDPMPRRVLTRLLGIGLRVEVVGPWEVLAPGPVESPALPVVVAQEASHHDEAARAFLAAAEAARHGAARGAKPPRR